MNVITHSEILAAMKAQHTAMDMLMAALLIREGELERAGLIERKDMFRPTKSGDIWEAVKSGHATIEKIEAGHRLVAD